jgi:teichuronic acid biosynthesis glycosyltransferase TuaG
MQNFISIITPCYNTKIEYLEKCLNSIKNQTYKNFECIIVNDCSTDVKTIDFIKEYIKTNKNFYLINNEKNLGCGMTRENGLKHAKGNIIMFSDSDD